MNYFFLLLVPVVFATHPRVVPCCTHFQFESIVTEIGGIVDPLTGNVTLIDYAVKLYYDYAQRMMRADRIVNGKLVTVMTNYHDMMSYTIMDGKCTATKTNQSMTEPCIPLNAKYIGTDFLGSIHDRQHLDMHTFRIDMPQGYTLKVSVTEDDCTPLAESMYGTINGVPTELTYFFSNFTKGIDHLEALRMPAECHGAAPVVGKRSYEEDLPKLSFTLY